MTTKMRMRNGSRRMKKWAKYSRSVTPIIWIRQAFFVQPQGRAKALHPVNHDNGQQFIQRELCGETTIGQISVV